MYHEAVMWTAKSLRKALAKLPADTRVLMDGCSCCTKQGGEGIRPPGQGLEFAVLYREQTASKFTED